MTQSDRKSALDGCDIIFAIFPLKSRDGSWYGSVLPWQRLPCEPAHPSRQDDSATHSQGWSRVILKCKESKCQLVHQNPRFYLVIPEPPLKVLKVLKPTVSREYFWKHSIKKWWDTTSAFILNDNIICFIAFWIFLVQKMVTKKTQKIGLPDPPFLI